MIRHRHHLLLAFGAVALLAPLTRADRLSSEIKSSASASAYHQAIMRVISAEVANLSNPDPNVQKPAREALVFEAEAHNGSVASSQYYAEYAADLSGALTPLVAPAKPLRVRLNAAIVACQVAAITSRPGAGGAGSFAALDKTLLADKQTAVVLWGMKLSTYVVGQLALDRKGPQDNKAVADLTGAVVQTAKSHQDSGPIIEEAYAALTLDPFASQRTVETDLLVIPDLLKLMQWRADQFGKADDPVPPSPQAESKAATFLPVGNGYKAVTSSPALQNQTLQTVGDLTCSILQVVSAGNGTPELVETGRQFGGALAVFGMQLNSTALSNAGNSIHSLPTSAQPAMIAGMCKTLAAAMLPMGVQLRAPAAAGGGPAPANAGGNAGAGGAAAATDDNLAAQDPK